MKTTNLFALLASTCMMLGSTQSRAASAQTDAFVANVRPNINFLDRASRLALDKSPSQRIRTFAHEEAEEQTIAANSFVAWTQTHTPSGEAVALGGGGVAVVTAPVGGILNSAGQGVNQVLSPLGPVGSIAAAPLTVAGTVTDGVGTVVNGTVGTVLPGVVAVTPRSSLVGSGLLPADQNNMDRLGALEGHQFDMLYRSSQQDSLRQLAGLYTDYLSTGDDPALQSLAGRELPKVNHRLAELDHMRD